MADKKDRVTIKDVAIKANVTAQTVSRVIRSSGYVSEETRRKVLDTIKALNYIPSYAGKALRTGMARSIALVFDSLINFYFSIMIDYLRKEIAKCGYSLQLLFSDKHVVTNETYRKAISHGAVAVISFLEGESGLGDVVKACGIPLVILGRSTTDEGLDYITTDDVYGGSLAAQRLIDADCTKFVYVNLGDDMSCVLDRGKGFGETLKSYGYSFTEYNTTHKDLQKFSAEIALQDPSLGIFCFNDVFAITILKQMKDIPNDVRAKIIGYDNIQQEVVLPINLTTIGADKEKYSEFILSKLVERLQNGVRLAEYQAVRLFEGETT